MTNHNTTTDTDTDTDSGPTIAPITKLAPAPEPTSDIANVVECEAMLYGAFHGRYGNLDARRNYSGTHLYVPCMNGQIVRVTVQTLSPDDAAKYRKGEAP